MSKSPFSPRYEAKTPISRIAHENQTAGGKEFIGRRKDDETTIDSILSKSFKK